MKAGEIFYFQIKMIRKGTKPPIWRRAYVPANITFTQMALILEELLELPKSDRFEFEFFQKKDRVIEFREEEHVSDYYYSYLSAPDTWVNEWFFQESWFTFRIRGMEGDIPEYRVEIEKILERIVRGKDAQPLDYPLLVRNC